MSLFFELIEILTRQNETVEEQLKASQEQNEALRRLDKEKLDGTVKCLEELTGRMAELDQQRELTQQELEQTLNLRPGATLAELLPKAPFELLFKLKGLSTELKQNLAELSEVNQINNILTLRVLQVNADILELFKYSDDKKTYQHSGQIKKSGRSNALLNKTV